MFKKYAGRAGRASAHQLTKKSPNTQERAGRENTIK
jgi:hypothetical protein